MEVHLPKASRVIRQNQLPNTGKPVHENNNGNAQLTTDESGNRGYARGTESALNYNLFMDYVMQKILYEAKRRT